MVHETISDMKDRFSDHASDYARYRPGYPEELITFIVSLCENTDKMWDCATGNGQVATMIAPLFREVYASDVSRAQIAAAPLRSNVEYSIQKSESTNYPNEFFDLIIVAQAIHWFDFDLFFIEANRVLKDSGVFVMTGYGLATINHNIDQIIGHFYNQIVGPYWDPERKHIEEHYTTVPFPFKEIDTPKFSQEMNWTLDQFLGYLATWSSVKRYEEAEKADPVLLIKNEVKHYWKSDSRVKFPILLRAGYKI